MNVRGAAFPSPPAGTFLDKFSDMMQLQRQSGPLWFAQRRGFVNTLYVAIAAVICVLGVLTLLLVQLGSEGKTNHTGILSVHCAAGLRHAVDPIAKEYEQEFGVRVLLNYAGSETLLGQIELNEKVGKSDDLYLSADESYMRTAQQRELVREAIPVAVLHPVIVVKRGNPKRIQGVEDLLRDDVTTVLGNPDQAAVGMMTKKLLTASGHWDRLLERVNKSGTMQPTVPAVANSVKISHMDAGIIWDATAAQHSDLDTIRTKELQAGGSRVLVGVLASSKDPPKALHFARYLSARDKGLLTFVKKAFEVVDGDGWADQPTLTFYSGGVNRRAIKPVVDIFREREGVDIRTKFEGCGFLTSQMRAIREQRQESSFPDIYMACDRYYLDAVQDWFQEDVDVSDTEVVIVVPKGNPANVRTLADLTRPDVRVTVGEPEHCTIGVLTRELLERETLYDDVMKNVRATGAVMTSSSLLIPTVTTGSADATLAYRTDTIPEAEKINVIPIGVETVLAIQPLAIAKSSDHKELARRLMRAILDSQESFEAAGFNWRGGGEGLLK